MKTREIAKKLLPGQVELTADDVRPAREYIATYWKELTRFEPEDKDSLIGLPKPYVVPSYHADQEFNFNEMFYWDSYFIAQGLLDDEHKELVLGILDNFVYMFKRFGIVPNASRTYTISRSQPPFLSSLIFDIYERYHMPKSWLKKYIKVAQDEYFKVWMGSQKPNVRRVYKDLSRYYDINVLNDLAEAESGWDMTSRFARKCLNYLPVDLNALLYKYEMDFALAAEILGNKAAARLWQEKAESRRIAMNELMWSHLKGFYFDYNYKHKRQNVVRSLAGFYPLWAGLVNDKQAKQMVKVLRRFEHKGGLATTDTQPISQMVPGTLRYQWSYPNGWAPLHYLVVKGLLRYGYDADARRIAMKWLKNNLDWFNKYGEFLEKYNVVSPEKSPNNGVYPTQTGFGWTNGVFEALCREFIDD